MKGAIFTHRSQAMMMWKNIVTIYHGQQHPRHTHECSEIWFGELTFICMRECDTQQKSSYSPYWLFYGC